MLTECILSGDEPDYNQFMQAISNGSWEVNANKFYTQIPGEALAEATKHHALPHLK
ncbi:hypothetical protein B2K_39160 [Paenibacillus mucilaginosus K02]|uniref:Uncharacterized protein n=1 Tax=Paenibacillus mucilaginosus K02 TaxID=997761 RepID=R9ULH2_9BACL|nr:hypothetical protein B2K_39160 [Paenibacillus mucilaginosus K02]